MVLRVLQILSSRSRMIGILLRFYLIMRYWLIFKVRFNIRCFQFEDDWP